MKKPRPILEKAENLGIGLVLINSSIKLLEFFSCGIIPIRAAQSRAPALLFNERRKREEEKINFLFSLKLKRKASYLFQSFRSFISKVTSIDSTGF